MSDSLKCFTPVDGSLYLERPYMSADAIPALIEKAQTAQAAWKLKSVADRAALLTKCVENFVAKQDKIGEELAWQMGRPIRYGAGEVGGFNERATYMLPAAEKALAPIAIEEKDGFTRYIKREPLGVVFTIAPWNFPYMTAVNSIVPALMAGNALILKHATQTHLCGETMRDAFVEAGRIKKHEAMRRHLQYIGKVMRTEDHEAIAHRVALFDTTSAAYNKLFHQLELKRDALIGENSKEVLSQYLDENPEIEDIQLLRQLIRQSQKEVSQGANTTNRKKLFRFLREVEEKRLGLKD